MTGSFLTDMYQSCKETAVKLKSSYCNYGATPCSQREALSATLLFSEHSFTLRLTVKSYQFVHEITWLLKYWFFIQVCTTKDGEKFERGTKIFTFDCRRECTCTGNGLKCKDFCSKKPYKCAGDEEPKFKTVRRVHKGKVCECKGKYWVYILMHWQHFPLGTL